MPDDLEVVRDAQRPHQDAHNLGILRLLHQVVPSGERAILTFDVSSEPIGNRVHHRERVGVEVQHAVHKQSIRGIGADPNHFDAIECLGGRGDGV